MILDRTFSGRVGVLTGARSAISSGFDGAVVLRQDMLGRLSLVRTGFSPVRCPSHRVLRTMTRGRA